jgi:hypothetical protein
LLQLQLGVLNHEFVVFGTDIYDYCVMLKDMSSFEKFGSLCVLQAEMLSNKKATSRMFSIVWASLTAQLDHELYVFVSLFMQRFVYLLNPNPNWDNPNPNWDNPNPNLDNPNRLREPFENPSRLTLSSVPLSEFLLHHILTSPRTQRDYVQLALTQLVRNNPRDAIDKLVTRIRAKFATLNADHDHDHDDEMQRDDSYQTEGFYDSAQELKAVVARKAVITNANRACFERNAAFL